MTRRKRQRFNRGLAVAGPPASLASFGRRPCGRGGGPRTAPPVTGRLGCPPYPAAAPASTTTEPSASRWIRQSPEERHRHGSGTNALSGLAPPAYGASPSRYAGRAFGAPLTLETSASPAGLTARARPKARPVGRAANLRE